MGNKNVWKLFFTIYKVHLISHSKGSFGFLLLSMSVGWEESAPTQPASYLYSVLIRKIFTCKENIEIKWATGPEFYQGNFLFSPEKTHFRKYICMFFMLLYYWQSIFTSRGRDEPRTTLHIPQFEVAPITDVITKLL